LPIAALRLRRCTFLKGKNHDPDSQQIKKESEFPPSDISDATRAGWNESLDKYAGVLAVNVFREGKK
jgi:hypothetical protein